MARGKTNQPDTKPQTTEATGEATTETVASVETTAETSAAPVDVNQEGEPAQEIQGVEVQSDTAGTGEAIKADEDTSSVPPVVVPTPQVSVSAESKSTSASEPVVLHHGGATIENITKPAAPVDVNQGLTKVVINYPEDYKGQRHYKNGAIAYVSKESAAAFVKAGIARIL